MTTPKDRDEPPRPAPGAATPSAGRTIEEIASTTKAFHAAARSVVPQLEVPKGGGAVRGIGEKFSTNPATGTYRLSVPIPTSAGRAGFKLELELAYDSGSGNGVFGLGWHLGSPAISRKTDKGLPRYGDDDVFVLSGAEDLVPVRTPDAGALEAIDRVVDGVAYRVQRFCPRVEDQFARIERWTDRATSDAHWRTIDRDNVTSIFGKSPDARIADPAHPDVVFSWLIEETRDDHGNVARYVYKAEDGAGVDRGRASEHSRFASVAGAPRLVTTAQRYLKRIHYGNATADPQPDFLFELVFDYGEHDRDVPTPDEIRPWRVRPDAFSTHRPGFEVRTYRLFDRVLGFHRIAELSNDPVLVRSTDFAYEETPVVTYLRGITQAGYRLAGDGYDRAELPTLELDYTRATIHDQLRVLDRDSREGVAGGVEGRDQLWVDLDGEGLPGILIEAGDAWYYKANRGGGRFAAPARQRELPAPHVLKDGVQQLTDVDGDGLVDLVQYAAPLPGYFERTEEGGWRPFRPFRAVPQVDWQDPNLRFVDLDGDGHPDVLLTEDDAFVWYRSRATDGFEPAASRPRPRDERRGPAVVFADATETIHLADMSGDGLTDLVRIRNGEVCYWPNLGYGRFGAKVTMDVSPTFDLPDRFDPARVHFADIDGSGTTDLVYAGSDRITLHLNQSGNGFAAPVAIHALPTSDLARVLAVVDLLGTGTACLVWSSRLAGDAARPVAYVDLMASTKPHLLARIANNLGAETAIAYTTSTACYLADVEAGQPWVTRLPFVVHVLDQIVQVDRVANSRLVRRFRYHHGYFDGVEREFRGFAHVEQRDAETVTDAAGAGARALPPILIKTWYHHGAWLERERLERALAGDYYADPVSPHLRSIPYPAGLTVREEREVARALRGQVLRQETYAEDNTASAAYPYVIAERNHEVAVLQRAHGNEPSVLHVRPREGIYRDYERDPADPRTHHEVVLAIDDYGNVTLSAAIAYPRRVPVQPEQAEVRILATWTSFENRTGELDTLRIGTPIEMTVRELTGLAALGGLFTPGAIAAALAGATEIDFEIEPDRATLQSRLLRRQRVVYYRDDLAGPLPLGQAGTRALRYHDLRQVFTPGLLARVFGADVDDALLQGEAGYLFADGAWWAASDRVELDPAQFYLPVRSIDPLGNAHALTYDAHALLLIRSEDALHNATTADNDYRILGPALVTDPNQNRVGIEYDLLGMVRVVAVMGKAGAGEGDTLADPTQRSTYDPTRWQRTKALPKPLPAYSRSEVRETHGDPATRWFVGYTYADGSGRTVLEKTPAEPGPVPVLDGAGHVVRDPDGAPVEEDVVERWVGRGRTVYDNKGNAIKRYEPFFSRTPEYEDEAELVEWGVSPVFGYDPLGRLVRTDHPDGTLTRTDFHPWERETWDENDTVAESTWLAEQQAGTPDQQRGAALSLAHVDTPTRMHFDGLGRVVLGQLDDGPRGLIDLRSTLDILGHRIDITDARGVRTRQSFDMLGRRMQVDSADAGESHTLRDVMDHAIRTWDPRGFAIRRTFDELGRPLGVFERAPGGGGERLVEYTVYGERHPQAVDRDLRGRVYQAFDGSGVEIHARYDFKGNLLETTRRLARDFRAAIDWTPVAAAPDLAAIEVAADALLEAGGLTTTARYDALDRAYASTAPDASETIRTFNAGNLLETIAVRVHGDAATTIISNIDYNARAQRTAIRYGNGTEVTYTYDRRSFRLTHLRAAPVAGGAALQDLTYAYDAVGHVVAIRDGVSFGNAVVSADARYEYDAIGWLVTAEGREHPGQQPSEADALVVALDHPNDLQAMRRYRETYTYDLGGNLERVDHVPLDGSAGWARVSAFDANSNRLVGAGYQHDAAGHLSRMPHLPVMDWDRDGRLHHVRRQVAGPEVENDAYYAYDAGGRRVRKVYAHGAVLEETIYLPDYEVYRRRDAATGAVTFERQTVHAVEAQPSREHASAPPRAPRAAEADEDGEGSDIEGQRETPDGIRPDRPGALASDPRPASTPSTRVAMIETTVRDDDVPGFAATTRFRFILDAKDGSSSFELTAAAAVISYEEYFPYGATAFRASATAIDVSAKRYRYVGKERDEESGFYAFGARYYAPWLGRWTSTDPLGLGDGPNPYAYVRNAPTVHRDLDGRLADDPADPISPGALRVLASAEAQGLPILTAILASPTLRPRDVERAAANGTLANFSLHPGSTFLGTIGEALMIHNLRSQNGGAFGNISSIVIPQPGAGVLPPGAGLALPDFLSIQVGFTRSVLFFRVQQRVAWNNTIGPTTGGMVSRIDHGPNVVVSLWEVTTTTRFALMMVRAVKVAAWARALGGRPSSGGTVRASVLAIDRGAFFSLTPAERNSLVNTVTNAGGYIAVIRDLTSMSIANARILQSQLVPVSRP